MRRTLLSALLVCLVSIGLRAESRVAGTWSDAKFTLELNQEGDNVTGTVTESGLEPRHFSNGSTSGSKLRFTTIARLNGEDRVLEWSGKVLRDELTLTREFPSVRPNRRRFPPFNRRRYLPFNGPFVLHRSK